MNAFECPRCKKCTRHVEISFREAMAVETKYEGRVAKAGYMFGAALFEVTGIGKLIQTVAGDKNWKCCDCGLVTTRYLDGSISSIDPEWYRPK